MRIVMKVDGDTQVGRLRLISERVYMMLQMHRTASCRLMQTS